MRAARTVVPFALALALPLGLVACGSDDDQASTDTSAPAAEGGVQVEDPWCRTSPAMATAGACYMVLVNDGDTDDALVSASVPASVAGKVEIHETTMADGHTDDTMGDDMAGEMGEDMGGEMSTTTMMSGIAGLHEDGETDDTSGGMGEMEMRPVDEIPIPAGGEAVLEPGGYHIMLLELPAPLEEGSTVELTLELESGETLDVSAPVRSA